MIEIEWEGQAYRSVAAAARAHGVKWSTMKRWIARGGRCSRGSSVPIRDRGLTFASGADMARHYGVTTQCVNDALNRGRLEYVGTQKHSR